ncbi:hypothetical protein Ahy_B04g071869 isoform C [Arachis hypogaea]|uniref:Leucine-rich repeat-containing N-terminal plant-type domain-containing protein n=1 Tax=Arachis hypogaea TaxID=3818 RepID=A0A444ZLV6_ARAHY|nr:hypothetical protein Ahy_B04g071869 isoform C [Arachis hypogaea]
MGTPTTWFASVFFFWVLIIESSLSEGCLKQEKDVLLYMKGRFSDMEPYAYPDLSRLQKWEPYINWVDGTDCCQWKGVRCNAITGRVATLTLLDQNYIYDQPSHFNFSDFLVFEDLKALYIDGIDCCVEDAGIQRRKLRNLEVLELDFESNGACKIEHCFSAISSLKSLRLNVATKATLTGKSFQASWKKISSKLRNLEHLYLSLPYLPNEILPSMKKLTSLRTLNLAGNGLDNKFNFSVELGERGSSADTIDDSSLSGIVRRNIRTTMVGLNMPAEGSQEGSNAELPNADMMQDNVKSHEGSAIRDPMMDPYEVNPDDGDDAGDEPTKIPDEGDKEEEINYYGDT